MKTILRRCCLHPSSFMFHPCLSSRQICGPAGHLLPAKHKIERAHSGESEASLWHFGEALNRISISRLIIPFRKESRQLSYRQSYQSQREHVFADCSFTEVLDRIDGPVLYKKGCALTGVAHREEETFNDDEQDIPGTFDEMAAVRRHVYGRLFVRPDLVSNQYFWRQTRTRSVHR
jgi:hypothetical protein